MICPLYTYPITRHSLPICVLCNVRFWFYRIIL